MLICDRLSYRWRRGACFWPLSPFIPIVRWMVGGAVVGLLGPRAMNGIPYDDVVPIILYLLGGVFGGALLAAPEQRNPLY